ncbi:SPOR domain-containing protein [Amphritea sp. 1_MG-2023]|uniref:SPOR domain-containing protein n=1 Tax=Amphritea sp. 1_MG-2023 TaxID=3062670 RepID=UPI0026E257DE|nr:SPOR domain-containing protein [Amphritea sp. 1_MG-2023]MDO6564211.1 SPOR domain-containing protein [Amphritea sp. 1_MG-2023]
MNDGFKQRLAGAAILFVAAGILLPIFFDGAGYRERHMESAIPPPPVEPQLLTVEPHNTSLPDTTTIAPPSEPVTVAVMPKQVAAEVAKQKPVISQRSDPPALDQENIPVAWSLQLASFKDEDNAKGLSRRLIKAGHKVYIRKTGDLIRVFVGPDIQKSKLVALQAAIQKEFGLDGIIVRFTTR